MTWKIVDSRPEDDKDPNPYRLTRYLAIHRLRDLMEGYRHCHPGHKVVPDLANEYDARGNLCWTYVDQQGREQVIFGVVRQLIAKRRYKRKWTRN
jgi:hypothetical protein